MQRQQIANVRGQKVGTVIVPGAIGNARAAAVSVLLVTRNDAWMRAVECATQQLGFGLVATCGARDAISRLARIAPHYSHVLVNEADADGLFAALADITTEIAEPDTDMLALGKMQVNRPNIRVIGKPTTQSVRDALEAQSPALVAAAMDKAELQAALDGAMIETRYQPIIRISDRQPMGMEALARLNHPERGTILPDRFIPQIESAGLSGELTRVVTNRAFADLTGPFLADRGLRMSVNFPLDVLETRSALHVLEEQRQAFGIAPHQIIVELTESRPVSDVCALQAALEHLRRLGYGIAIDDVSPAVVGVDTLIDLPFTYLKFDKDLVQDSVRSPAMRDFVARKAAAAKKRGLYVIAEGVETEEIWNEIAACGVDAAQGFLASRPLPVAAIPIWWDSWVDAPGLG
ncbi:MAG TPA: EAL domain-containing protein [Rhodopila sp.]|jgi:EAL domain-containing protein (putative c-di-GMP-specific phosphodiesterase class I)|nr:EAL domain-containing protein [Rhodopila sp.]